MTLTAGLQLALFAALVVALTPPVGRYLHRVFEGDTRPWPRVLGRVERAALRACGVDATAGQTWREYATALALFSAVGLAITCVLLRAQHALPLNPRQLAAVPPALALETAVSFVTNTNWQSYAGESTMSTLSQMAALAWQNFVSAAAGLAVALAVARGITRRAPADVAPTLGNFWADLVRGTLYVLLPLSVACALLFASQGVVQTFAPPLEVSTLDGGRQVLSFGPVASQLAIKLLGTNGGGFFNANSAHPFENPTATTNLVQLVLIFLLPAGLTWTYGRMAGAPRHGWALFGAMAALCLAGAWAATWAEAQGNPALRGLEVLEPLGNMEGKESRFGVAASALFATVTTDASCGAVNAMHDSFTPLGGLVPLVNILLGEVVFGGVGAGLYGVLMTVVLAVFLAGLMVGRTPEYLGKKLEARELTLATLYALVAPFTILGLTAWAAVTPHGAGATPDAGPHGLTRLLYAFASAAGNNGSAFAGLDATTTWWHLAMSAAMLAGRFLCIVPALALSGGLAAKRVVPAGPGTFPTDGPLFAVLLVAVLVLVGALTFLPALCLGPVLEQALAARGVLS